MNPNENESPHHGRTPEVNFSQFIFMQYQQAKMMLGEIPNPITGEKDVNIPMAKYTIDILAMIGEKTKGNLDADEESLLGNILHELRLNYVREQTRAEAKGEAGAASEAETREEPDDSRRSESQ